MNVAENNNFTHPEKIKYESEQGRMHKNCEAASFFALSGIRGILGVPIKTRF